MKYKLMLLPLFMMGSAMAQGQGAYLGFKVGAESITSELTGETVTFDSVGKDGGVLGAYVGYQIPFMSESMIALEAEHLNHDFELGYTGADNTQLMEMTTSNSISTLLKTRFNDQTNVYLRLGLAQSKLEFTSGSGDVIEDDVKGAIAGFGVEFLNESDMTFRMEYRYTTYDEMDAFVLDDESSLATELNSHSFSIGAHYRF